MNGDIAVHVYPLNDIHTHQTDTPFCDCHPRLEPHGESLLVIHNAWDCREYAERAAETADGVGLN